MAVAKQNELVRRFKHARRAHTPLVSVATPDQFATVALIAGGVNDATCPKVSWDIGGGFVGVNQAGVQWVAEKTGSKVVDNPVIAFRTIQDSPDGSTFFVYNSHRFLENIQCAQLLANARDKFKANKRTIVLLGPQVPLPSELANDVVELDEPYPDDAELQAICQRCYDGWKNVPWKLSKQDRDHAASALKGCSSFGAEQHFTMAAQKSGIIWDDLNASVQKTIEQTNGLTYERGTETFADIGGLQFLKTFAGRLFSGPERPSLVVRMEEIEKATGNAANDLSNTSQDALQVMLSSMEDYGWSGIIAYGGPGTGKSMACKAMANSYDTRGLVFDINATKGGIVGQSEQQVREAVKVIRSIGGDNVFFVASCNDASTINTALKRRFFRGIWFFDVPCPEDAKKIWAIQMKRWNIEVADATVNEADLTGADIRNICRQAYSLQCTLAEAREYVVPLKMESPEDISGARAAATDRYLDAARGGTYRIGGRAASGSREITIGDDE